ncbi:Gfo/Idh/MocA family protein [Oryzibacter oryziterrae]|uniref:Gfo/Idh/MocA family protein n=1 Tax=Oryzibacter oryziterrae TaxID=2766474 RepID=UPI001F2F43E2|nr:Gfo/Idh/MocA family oxidoreductase [Oryzibacter oryziterrae]
MVMRVGVIGCGNISDIYLRNGSFFRDYRVTAVADLRPEAAKAQGEKYGVPAYGVDELLKRDDVDTVLNLTVPAAHAEVCLKAIEAGKHVHTEKPLATTLEDGRRIVAAARAKGVRVGAAPDTILGAGIQHARALIDAGRVGSIVTGTATVLGRGMEHWHPNPEFFFKPGAGPVLDMGPYYIAALVTLLGPVRTVSATGKIGRAQRLVTAEGPMKGKTIDVEVLTTVNGLLSFANGAEVVFMTSWDVWAHGQRPIELHGVNASLRVPDPNFFGGTIELAEGTNVWSEIATTDAVFGRINWPLKPAEQKVANYRGLGLADMGAAIREGRQHRTNGDFALHVLAVMLGLIESAEAHRPVGISESCDSPAPLGETEAASLI